MSVGVDRFGAAARLTRCFVFDHLRKLVFVLQIDEFGCIQEQLVYVYTRLSRGLCEIEQVMFLFEGESLFEGDLPLDRVQVCFVSNEEDLHIRRATIPYLLEPVI